MLLRAHLIQALADIASPKPSPPADFWFARSIFGQGSATTLSWALVLRRLESDPPPSPAVLYAPFHGSKRQVERDNLVRSLWLTVPERAHQTSEVLVDFAVFVGQRRGSPWFTAESEMYSEHVTNAQGDYAWDFFKLLLLPSPRRLFVCRVGNECDPPRSKNVVRGGTDRRRELRETLDTMLAGYTADDRLLQPGDELAIALLAGEKDTDDWRDCWIAEYRHGANSASDGFAWERLWG